MHPVDATDQGNRPHSDSATAIVATEGAVAKITGKEGLQIHRAGARASTARRRC